MLEAAREPNSAARELFAPLAPTYDLYARLFSLGQDPRWRRFLVERVAPAADDVVLDVACGTGAVSLLLARRYGCRVVGIDQSPEMVAEGRRLVSAAGFAERVDLQLGRAEELPFPTGTFSGLTCTYLLRYVADPSATLRELARVVRPGGRVALLDFYVPPGSLPRAAWKAYVRVGLPLLGRVASPAWGRVGRFLGPSITDFWRRYPLPALLRACRDAGLADVRHQTLSLGGGVVLWGTRGD